MVHNGGVSDPLTYADPHSDAPMEYLDTGRPARDRPRRKARRWAPVVAGAVTFVIVLVGVGVVAVDWVGRNLEMRQLVTQIEVSEGAMAGTQVDLANAIEDFRAKPSPTDADRTTLETALKAAAAKGLVGVTKGGDLVQSVRVTPWHADIKAAQKAYLAHNHAWQDYLGKAAKDPAEFTKTQEAVNSTFANAEQPLRNAVPRPDPFDLALRINVIYAADPTAEDGSGQQA
jgi:hypothetical protein